MEYNIIIAGSRDFTDYNIVDKTVRKFLNSKNIIDKPTIICGMARGADMLGYVFAKRYNFPLQKFPADWSLGRKAGPIRNEKMAKYARDNGNGILLAFWDGWSKGTQSMINLAKKYDLEIHVFNFDGDEMCIAENTN